jgi:hypothetical protein
LLFSVAGFSCQLTIQHQHLHSNKHQEASINQHHVKVDPVKFLVHQGNAFGPGFPLQLRPRPLPSHFGVYAAILIASH